MPEYIEREAIKAAVRKRLNNSLIIGLLISIINEVPTANVAPVVHGRWVEKQEPLSWCEDDVDVFWECSVCGTASCGESNYCPNCGARMDGAE